MTERQDPIILKLPYGAKDSNVYIAMGISSTALAVMFSVLVSLFGGLALSRLILANGHDSVKRYAMLPDGSIAVRTPFGIRVRKATDKCFVRMSGLTDADIDYEPQGLMAKFLAKFFGIRLTCLGECVNFGAYGATNMIVTSGEKIKTYRIRQNMTQKDLAVRADVPLRMIQAFEQNVKPYEKSRYLYMWGIANALSVTPESLFGDDFLNSWRYKRVAEGQTHVKQAMKLREGI